MPPKSPYPLQSGPVQFGASRARAAQRTAAARRRRNLTNLAIFIIATFVLGMVPPLRFLLWINLVADVALVLYLGLALFMAIWPPPEKETVPVMPQEAPPQAAAAGDAGF